MQRKRQENTFLVLPNDMKLVILRFLSTYDVLNVAQVCKSLNDTVWRLNTLWSTVDISYGVSEELLKVIVVKFGEYIHTLYISDTILHENNSSSIEISTLNKAITMCTNIQRLIITHIDYGIFDFWTPISQKCPKLSWIEVHSCTNSSIHITIAKFLLNMYPNLEHLTLEYEENFLHTQRTTEGIKSVINLLEKEFKRADLLPSKWNQYWKTLQFLYKKIGDTKSAEMVLDKAKAGGINDTRIKSLQEMDDRLLSDKCSRPLDVNTCYYWNLCFTCGLIGFSGLCARCVNTCHKGHQTIFKYVSSGAYCDCSTHTPKYHIAHQ